MAIHITDAKVEQEQDILAFYRWVYRQDHPLANEKFLHWWLRDNPYFTKKGFSAKLAMDGQKIAGHYGYTPVGLWMQGAVHRAFWAGNLVVDEAYRRQGIGGQLIAALRDEGEIGLDLGASPIAEPMLVKEGWWHLGALHRWVGVLDASRARGIAADQSAIGACVLPRLMQNTDEKYEIRPIERFNSEHDVFWEIRRKTIACATNREAAYLNWRYADHPVFKYKMYEICKGNDIQGYAIMREEQAQGIEQEITVMRVVDMLAHPGYEEPLLRHLMRKAQDSGAVLMDFFCASARYGAVLEKYGFKREPWSGRIARLFSPVVLSKWPISFNVIATNTAAGSELPSQEEWYVTTGDGDQDRPNKL